MLFAAMTLAGCDSASMPGFLKSDTAGEEATRNAGGVRGGGTVERDIEAPEIFQATERGLWDGRPSLGGVWVAHPEVTEPERVIIRNQQNGQFVIGALFKRERETPGPVLQVSSDAAAALEMLAGQPAELDVVALRREEATDPDAAAAATVDTADLSAASDVESGALDPVTSGAGAALAPETPAAPEDSAAAPAPAPVETAAAPARPAPQASPLDKPYLQIGIFSVEQNARNTAEAMRQAGLLPAVKKQSSSGKTFWRVIVGPAQSASERSDALTEIKAQGFTDAYAVTD